MVRKRLHKMKFYCKDFEIESVYVGSRLVGGPTWAYRVYYNAPDGRQTSLKELFYKKADAKRAISKHVKLLNAVLDAHEARSKSECQ